MIDRPLLYAALALFIGGMLILTSASMVLSYKTFGSVGGYAFRQLLYGGGLGLLAMLVFSRLQYRTWRRFALPLLLVSFAVMALIFIPQLGFTAGGATRWLKLGPITFQPSEILKLSFIIYLASWLDARRREVASVSYGMIPFLLMLSVVGVFLVMQPDIGTLFVIAVTGGLMYFLGGGKVSQVIAIVLFGATGFYLLARLAPYRIARLLVFLNPWSEPQGAGYQITQAFIAIGSGRY